MTTKHTYIAMAHGARELGRLTAANIKAAARQAKQKWGREVEYVTTLDGLAFHRIGRTAR